MSQHLDNDPKDYIATAVALKLLNLQKKITGRSLRATVGDTHYTVQYQRAEVRFLFSAQINKQPCLLPECLSLLWG